MPGQKLAPIFGFIALFILYHAAEYMIVFKNSPAGFLVFQLFFFLAAWLIAKMQSGRGLDAWGLDFQKGFVRHLVFGIIMGIILYGTTFFISLSAGSEGVNAIPSFAESVAPLSLFIFGNFFSSFSEDVLTRGYVYFHLKNRTGVWWIAILSAIIYVLNHIYRLNEGTETYTYLLCLGILYVIPLILTKRLWITGGMHWAGNVTFYYSHEILKTKSLASPVSANYILVVIALLLIPVTYISVCRTKWFKVT